MVKVCPRVVQLIMSAVASSALPTTTPSPTTSTCIAPPLDPLASQVVLDVKYTTALTDWQAGTMKPQNDLVTFSLKQPYITALLMNSSGAGTITVKNQFCSDGHDYADDDGTLQVPATSSPTWILASRWVYAAAHPDDVGNFMETIYWNGKAGHVSFLTILPTEIAYNCSVQPTRSVNDFSISNVAAAASITQQDTAYLNFTYDAAQAGNAEFYICVDGTTYLSSQTQLGPGSDSYQAYQPMIQASGTCISSGCELYGNARWIVVWNQQAVAQASFTVTS